MKTDAFRFEKKINKAKSHDIETSKIEREVTLLHNKNQSASSEISWQKIFYYI